jgi:hypothetical protein
MRPKRYLLGKIQDIEYVRFLEIRDNKRIFRAMSAGWGAAKNPGP